jgi:hypothetical protein
MTKFKNLRELLLGYVQRLDENNLVFYMDANYPRDEFGPTSSFTIYKSEVSHGEYSSFDAAYNSAMKELLSKHTHHAHYENEADLERIAINMLERCKRGYGNAIDYQYGVMAYVGSNPYDVPFVVYEKDGKYGYVFSNTWEEKTQRILTDNENYNPS